MLAIGPRWATDIVAHRKAVADAYTPVLAARAYYGTDVALYEARSVVTHAARLDVPLLLAVAEYENPLLDVHAAEMLYRVSAARGRAPRMVRLPRHNHTSIVAHIDTAEDRLGGEILDFIARGE